MKEFWWLFVVMTAVYLAVVVYVLVKKWFKKTPELWKKVAAELNAAPEACTLFDDSVEAIRGAKAAGMHTVGVADPYFASCAGEMAQTCEKFVSGFDAPEMAAF